MSIKKDDLLSFRFLFPVDNNKMTKILNSFSNMELTTDFCFSFIGWTKKKVQNKQFYYVPTLKQIASIKQILKNK